jgi:hypothetical protein
VARVLSVVPDLMLSSRVVESLSTGGHEVEDVNAVPASSDAEVVVCDLDSVEPERVVALERPSLGFYSHTDVETRERALAAGIDVVVPRSRMVRELPQLIEALLGS